MADLCRLEVADKSYFYDANDIPGLLDGAQGAPAIVQSNRNIAGTADAGRIIGWDKETKLPTSIYAVVTKPNGDLKTMHPGLR
jgi:hypothetical protein